jgi:hypothetical protein
VTEEAAAGIWLRFLETYRNLCISPSPEFLRTLAPDKPRTSQHLFVLYSSAAGKCPIEVSADNKPGAPTLFASFLSRHIASRDADIVAVAKAVQADVIRAAKAAGIDQRPVYTDDLGGETIYLAR